MKSFSMLLCLFLSNLLIAQPPNFVFILADDMGWNGTSIQISSTEPASVSDFYETPNLEQMALNGITFSQAYSPAPKCSPSRCSILNGKSTARNSFTETGNPLYPDAILIHPQTIRAIPTADVSIAEWLHSTGLSYRNAHYGKWHLSAGGPSNHGFDFSDGNTTNTTGDAGDGMTIQANPKKINDLAANSLQFMQNAVTDGVPFYLQISHYAVHEEIETTQASFDHFTLKTLGSTHDNIPYAGMMKDMDASIGLIMAKLVSLGIENNTYVIFLSDNGASRGHSSNAPLKRGKAFIYEGGIRVPMFVVGPGITGGTSSTEPVVGYDLYPTIAELTGSGTTLPTDLDGQSIVPILEQTAFSRAEPLYFHVPHYSASPEQLPRSAMVDGNYKLIVEYETGIDYLYDLTTDIGEGVNIASSNAALTLAMKIKMRNHLKDGTANMPILNETHANFTGTGVDIDADGLEDEWEFRELLSYFYGSTDDPDNDGSDNLMEFTSGTDPLVNETLLPIAAAYELKVGIYEEKTILLSWANLNSSDVVHFEIEKLQPNNTWVSIGQIAKTSSQFIDEYPNYGKNYYRLKIVKSNAPFDYSQITQLEYSKANSIQVFPNPTKGLVQISFPKTKNSTVEIDIMVYNSVGQLVYKFRKEKSELVSFELKNESNGVYFIQVFENGNLLINSFVELNR